MIKFNYWGRKNIDPWYLCLLKLRFFDGSCKIAVFYVWIFKNQKIQTHPTLFSDNIDRKLYYLSITYFLIAFNMSIGMCVANLKLC